MYFSRIFFLEKNQSKVEYEKMSLAIATRINDLRDHMSDEVLKNECRMNPSDFTRKSPLNFVNLILLLLTKTGLTNTMELTVFFEKIGELNVTKEAFSQARLKLNPIVFKKLQKQYLASFYQNDNVRKEFKKYLLLACDGSKIELPHHKSLVDIFGGTKSKFGGIMSCMGNSSTVYDVLNKFVFDFEIESYKTSEKTLVLKNLTNLFKMDFLNDFKKIFIFDRGYRSIEFFHYFMKRKEKFVFRLRTKDYKKEKLKLRSNDQWMNIEITKGRLNHLEDEKLKSTLLNIGILNLRVITVTLVTGEIEYLITNLDKRDFKYRDIVEIYRLRWEIEVTFKTLKSLLKVENISGYTKIAVEQDLFSQILAYNITNDLRNGSQNKKDKNSEKSVFEKKKQGKINTNIVIGHFKLKIIKIFLENNKEKQENMLCSLILKLSKYYTNTSTKKYEHSENTPWRKNPTNNRRSF